MTIGKPGVSTGGVFGGNVSEAIEMTNAQSRKMLALCMDGDEFVSTENSVIQDILGLTTAPGREERPRSSSDSANMSRGSVLHAVCEWK